MKIKPYNSKRDREKMVTLFSKRDMKLSLIEDLPKNGFIVTHENGDPIAAGFLKKIEGKSGMFDGLITNPSRPGDVRSEAMDLVIDAVIERSKKLGLRYLVAYCAEDSLMKRVVSDRFGFGLLPHNVIGLELGG